MVGVPRVLKFDCSKECVVSYLYCDEISSPSFWAEIAISRYLS